MGRGRSSLGAGVALGLASGAMAQSDQTPSSAAAGQQHAVPALPQNPQVFGSAMPSVIKATAIVNGEVITQTDVQQRLQLLAIANGGQIPPEERRSPCQQVLRNLIDETLEIQAAKDDKIEIKKADIDKTVARVAQ